MGKSEIYPLKSTINLQSQAPVLQAGVNLQSALCNLQLFDDVNDHEQLRYDPALAIALKKLDFINSTSAVLAGKSTINRLEYCPETILNQGDSRYHRIEPQPQKIEKAFVDIFLDSYKKPPKQIVLDLDVTDDQVHGNQEGAFFNKYYRGVCYAPLYIFCGQHLLVGVWQCQTPTSFF